MICVSVAYASYDEILRLADEHDLIELRLDLLKLSHEDFQNILDKHSNIIVTYKHSSNIEDIADITEFNKNREKFFEIAIKYRVEYVDIDIEDILLDKIVALTNKNITKLIISYHDYKRTPKVDELLSIVKLCKSKNSHFVKISTFVKEEQDNITLLELLDMNNNIIVSGMGEESRIIRILSSFLGSPFTYASIDEKRKTAEGQYTVSELSELISR